MERLLNSLLTAFVFPFNLIVFDDKHPTETEDFRLVTADDFLVVVPFQGGFSCKDVFFIDCPAIGFYDRVSILTIIVHFPVKHCYFDG